MDSRHRTTRRRPGHRGGPAARRAVRGPADGRPGRRRHQGRGARCGRPDAAVGAGEADGKSLWWPVVGRNKRSVTLNLREPAGQDLLLRAGRHADVFVENFRPGTLEKWNLGYERLREVNPRLDPGAGDRLRTDRPLLLARRLRLDRRGDGRHALHRRASPTGSRRAPASRSATRWPPCTPTVGALAALHAPRRTGEGQVVDTRDLRVGAGDDGVAGHRVGRAGYQRERTGAVLPNVAPSNVYPTSDGQLILIAANQDSVFGGWPRVMGEPELAAEAAATSTTPAAASTRQELDDQIAVWTAKHDADELLDAAARGRRAGRPDLQGRGHARRPALHRPRGHRPGAGPDVRRAARCRTSSPSSRPRPARSGGPGRTLGQHNDEVYGGLLGLSDDERAPSSRPTGSSDWTVRRLRVRRVPRPDRLGRAGRRRRRRGRRPTSATARSPTPAAGSRRPAPARRRVVDAARAAGHPVVFTAVKLAPGGADAGWFAVKVPGLVAFEEGSPCGGVPRRARPRCRARSW